VIRVVDSPIMAQMKKKYIGLYCEVRKEDYPIEYSFLVTKVKFQDYVITEMFQNPSQTREIISAYTKIKEDKTIQEKAIKVHEFKSRSVPTIKIQ